MNPCPKLHVISSRMSFYKTTYDLSAPGSAPVVSVAVSTDLDYMRGSGDPTVTLLRGRLGLPDNLTLKDADDRRFVAFNPGTLDGKEADSLRRVGFESGDMFGGDYWWDGPSGRLYLAFGEHGIGLYCPQTGLHRRRALSGNYGPIWDPANHRVAIVRTDLIHVEPPISVTIWDYSVDKVTTYPLRPSPG